MHDFRVPSIVAARTPIQMKKEANQFEPGGKWEIVKEFNGRSHGEGGIDIEVRGGFVRHINSPNEKPDDIAKRGRFWRSLGAALYGAGEGLLDTVTLGATDKLTDLGYEALQKVGGSSADEIREQNSLRGYTTAAGAITGGILTGGATTGSAIQQSAKGIGAGVSQGSPDSKFAQQVGTWLPLAGGIAGMAMGNAGYGANATGAAGAMSKVNDAFKGIGKYSPYINMAGSLIRGGGVNAPQMMGDMMMTGGGMTPPMMPEMPMYSRQRGGGGGPSGGAGEGGGGGGQSFTPPMSYAGAGGEGPIQFRMPPIYQAESAQYLGKYGINV